MFAISFDMLISDLKNHCGEIYNNAYFEIATILEKFGFYRGQGSVYLSTNNDMANLLRALNALKNIDWFKNSVRDIRAFRIEDWSDFTSFIKEN
ncbi:MAG TPA: virulence protein [Brumimicrobium sp.]|nr:virulence protein [Brumimicrobium sp.]